MSSGHTLRNFAFASGVVCMGSSGTAAYFNHDLKAAQAVEAVEQTAANNVLNAACPMPSNDFEPACKPGTGDAIAAATQNAEAARDRVTRARIGRAVGKEVAVDAAGAGTLAALLAGALAGTRRKEGEGEPRKKPKSQWER